MAHAPVCNREGILAVDGLLDHGLRLPGRIVGFMDLQSSWPSKGTWIMDSAFLVEIVGLMDLQN